MQRIPVMDALAGDPASVAAVPQWGKTSVAKTADYTILPAATGTVFTNTGASAQVTLTLPTPKGGEWFTFAKGVTNKILSIKAPAGVTVGGSAAAKVFENTTTEQGTCTVVAINTTTYVVQAYRGTWAVNDA